MGNLLQLSLENKSLQPLFIVVSDFETIFVETDDQSKLWKLRKKQRCIIYCKNQRA